MSFAYRLGAAVAALCVLLGGPAADAQDSIVATVNGKTITETDMKLAEAEIGSDLGTLPEATRRRVLVEFLIENQLFADAADSQSPAAGEGSTDARSTGGGARCGMPISTEASAEPSAKPTREGPTTARQAR